MDVRIEPASQLHILAELLAAERLEALLAESETRLDELDVWSLAESIGDNRLVLLSGDTAGGVDDVASLLGVRGDGVDGAEDELLLEMREEGEVALGLTEGKKDQQEAR